MTSSRRKKLSAWIEVILFFSGILIFTYFITGAEKSILLAFAGIGLSFTVMVFRLRTPADLGASFGFNKLEKGSPLFLGIAILAGLLLGILYRQYLKLGLLPASLTFFALTASLIGGTEELVFRGFIQTKLRKVNIYIAIIFGALTHTGYKIVLFWSLQSGLEINFTGLIFWTILVGLLIGIIREASKSVVFAIIGHVAFDIIVYGDNIIAPWWIWS